MEIGKDDEDDLDDDDDGTSETKQRAHDDDEADASCPPSHPASAAQSVSRTAPERTAPPQATIATHSAATPGRNVRTSTCTAIVALPPARKIPPKPKGGAYANPSQPRFFTAPRVP